MFSYFFFYTRYIDLKRVKKKHIPYHLQWKYFQRMNHMIPKETESIRDLCDLRWFSSCGLPENLELKIL